MAEAPGATASLSAARINGRLATPNFLAAPSLQALLAALDSDGEAARVVGGAVRNALLERPVNDVDIATTATPDVVMARAWRAGWRTVPTGIRHGTVTVVVAGTPYEVTTLREDVETDGRHAVVRFGRDFARDAERRDFTINALGVDREGVLYDSVGGLADLATCQVRFIGEARRRIREDYLRILRFFRFHAAYATGALDHDGVAAAIAERDGLDRLSRERVRGELLKLLTAPGAALVVATMSEAGLLQRLLAGIAWPARFAAWSAKAAPDGAIDPVAALQALAVIVPDDAERLRAGLRLSNAETDRLAAGAAVATMLHGTPEPPSDDRLRELVFLHGRQAVQDGLSVAAAESGAAADDPAWTQALRNGGNRAAPILPFSGRDLLARGLKPGRAVGETLKRLQAEWIRAGFPRDPAALAALVEAAVRDADRTVATPP